MSLAYIWLGGVVQYGKLSCWENLQIHWLLILLIQVGVFFYRLDVCEESWSDGLDEFSGSFSQD